MALKVALRTPPAKVKQQRLLVQNEVHIVESSVTRLDGTGTLVSAIIDLTKGTVRIQQDTTPITFKKASDLDDIIEFYTNARDLLDNAPAGVTEVVVEAEATEVATA